jgi:hypothetical protein
MKYRLTQTIHCAFALGLFIMLSGCYCMAGDDEADATNSGYFSGCWKEASKNKGKTPW